MKKIKYGVFKLKDLFDIKRGTVHSSSALEVGETPLVSCKADYDGIEGYFDIPKNERFSKAVTIASDGQPLATFYHNYEFGAKDNVLVCISKKGLKLSTIYFIVARLNKQKWRYYYGRKCYLNRVDKVDISLPIKENGEIDQETIEKKFPINISERIPEKKKREKLQIKLKFKEFPITDLFFLERGDFHSIDALAKGQLPTVSRITDNNGIVGYYEMPEDAKVHPKLFITVSTTSSDAFVQLNDFIATDNVVICKPKKPMDTETLFFIQMMINKQKWKYSYGRQAYKRVFEKTKVLLPTINGKLDRENIKKIVRNTTYWKEIKNYIS
jgi:hypothetical protein